MRGNFGRLTQKGYILSRFYDIYYKFWRFYHRTEKDIQIVEDTKYNSGMQRVVIITSP